MVPAGFTEILGPVMFPGIQLYELAPLAEIVAELPIQIVVVPDAETEGISTVIVTTDVAVQLAPSVPVTV